MHILIKFYHLVHLTTRRQIKLASEKRPPSQRSSRAFTSNQRTIGVVKYTSAKNNDHYNSQGWLIRSTLWRHLEYSLREILWIALISSYWLCTLLAFLQMMCLFNWSVKGSSTLGAGISCTMFASDMNFQSKLWGICFVTVRTLSFLCRQM